MTGTAAAEAASAAAERIGKSTRRQDDKETTSADDNDGNSRDRRARGRGREPKRERVPMEKRVVPAGGVEFAVTQRELWRLIHQSRLADSFRIRIGSVKNIQNWGDLRVSVLRAPWYVCMML
jgi:hypothetical protein